MSDHHRRGYGVPVNVHPPQPVLSLEEAVIPSNAGFHDPVVHEPANHFANHDCNLASSISSSIYMGVDAGTDHRSGIRASNDIFVVPKPNRRRRTKEDNVGHLQRSQCAYRHASPDYLHSYRY